MNNKEKLFYLLEEKSSIITPENKTSPEFTKQKFEIQSLLVLIFDSLTKKNDTIKQDIFKAFENHPTIYADIVSSTENPNCSCRGRVASFFIDNAVTVKNIFIEVIQKHQDLEDDFFTQIIESYNNALNTFYQRPDIRAQVESSNKNVPHDLTGKVLTVKDDQEYFSIIKTLSFKKFQYKGINIIEKDGQLKLYFY